MAERHFPADLKDALSITPLTHLIPNQYKFPLINYPYLVPHVSEETEDQSIPGSNEDDSIYENIAIEVADYNEEDVEKELGDIKFNQYVADPVTKSIRESLDQRQQKVFDLIAFRDSLYLEQCHKTVKTSRLSVRKKYHIEDEESMRRHNMKYESKFNKEKTATSPILRSSNKRQRRDSTTDEISAVATRKLVKFSDLQLRQNAIMTIRSFISRFLYTDRQEDETNSEQLTTELLEQVLDAISKSIDFDAEVNVDELSSIQKVCHVHLVDSIAKLDVHLNTEDMKGICDTTDEFLKCALCCRIILSIMAGPREDKTLYVDAYLNLTVEYLNLFVENILIPLAGIHANNDEDLATRRQSLSKLFSEVGYFIKQLGDLNSRARLVHHMLTKFEILSTQILFEESHLDDKGSYLRLLPIDSIKIAVSSSIIEIFNSCPEERSFLIEEMLLNFFKISTTRSAARQFKVERGFNIHLYTLLLVKFVQCFVVDVPEDDEGDSHSTEIVDQMINKLLCLIADRFSSTSKGALHLILEDFLMLLPYPEWSAVELLLKSLTRQLLLFVQNQDNNPSLDVYLLDILESICGKVLALKTEGDNSSSTELGGMRDILTDFNSIKYDKEDSMKCFRTNFKCWKNEIPIEDANTAMDMDESVTTDQSPHNYTKNRIHYVYVSSMLEYGLYKAGESFLSSLGGFLESPKIKVKTKAIKILANLSETYPAILRSKSIQASLTARLLDSSTLVRDAVFDFVGKYVLAHQSEADSFKDPLCNALNDDGILVRKRAIKLAKDLYPVFKSRASKIAIAWRLLRRLADEEEAVTNLAVTTLLELWFLPLQSADEKYCMDVVSVLVELSSTGNKALKFVESFLEIYVLGSKDPLIQQATSIFVDRILDMVVGDNSISKKDGLLLLSICVRCKPKIFGQEQLVALHPIIVDDSQVSDPSYKYALRILKYSLPQIESLRPELEVSIGQFLTHKLPKLSHAQLHEAIPALWNLGEISNRGMLAKPTIATMKLLHEYLYRQGRQWDYKIGKLLQLLGCFGKYCDFLPYRRLFESAALGLKPRETVASLILKYLLQFTDKGPEQIRRVATTSLIEVCSNQLAFLTSAPVLSVLDREMNSGDPKMILCVIQGFITFLEEKDWEAGKKVGNNEKSSTNNKLDEKVFHGHSNQGNADGVCASLVLRYLDRMLKFCLKPDEELFYLPIKFVELVLEMGYANPKICAPTIIALEASPEPKVRGSAVRIHTEMFEKHESLVETSYEEGIRLGFEMNKANERCPRDFLNCMYHVVLTTHTSRKKCVKAISRILKVLSSSAIDLNDSLLFLTFWVENVAQLELKSTEEILILLHDMYEILSGPGQDFLMETKNDASTILCSSYRRALSLRLVLEAFRFLSSKYHITHDKIESFGSLSTEEMRQAPKATKATTTHVEWILENIKTNNEAVFQRCKRELNDFI